MSYYDDLGVDRDATPEQLTTAWRTKARTEAGESLRRSQLAYAVLADPERRRAYDQAGHLDADLITALLADIDRELLEVKQTAEALKDRRYFDAAEHGLSMLRRGWARWGRKS